MRVVIENYNPEWPSWYEHDRVTLTKALGDTALSIEHTGSTSVPDLPAKPIIDVLLLVRDTTDEDTYLPQLEAAGYEFRARQPEWYEHRLLYRRGAPHDANIHVFSPAQAAEEIERILTFRNWLRTHPDDKDRYAAAKRELSKQDWETVQNYADAKTDIIEDILAKAHHS